MDPNLTKKNEKQKSITIALIMMLTFSALIIALPSTNAEVIELDTYLWVMVAPNPVGVDQTTVVTFQLDKTSDTAVGLAGGDHFKGFMIKITKPDGSTEEKGPYEAWATSGAFTMFTPTQVGTYTFEASFPGQWVNQSSYQRYFKPSTSAQVELTVQQDPVEPIPNPALPTDAWTRPISAENKGWWQVSDNWLMKCYDYPNRQFCMSPAFSPYTAAPDSAHVLWNKPIIIGGLGGGSFGDKSYYTGLSYEQFYDCYIIEGKILYIDHPPTAGADVFGTRCLNLYTGEEEYYLEGASIDYCQVYDIENPNEHGLIAHLWDVSGPSSNTTAVIYDAFSGRELFTITNMTYGAGVSFYCGPIRFGPSGEILSYSLDAQNDRLTLWNSTKAIDAAFPWMGSEAGAIYSPRAGAVVDGSKGIEWDVAINTDIPAGMSIEIINVEEGYMMAYKESKTSRTAGFTEYPATSLEMGFQTNLQKNSAGEYPTTISPLWTQNRGEIANRVFYSRNIKDGVYTRWDSALMRLYGYDIKTGNEIWRTEPTSNSGWGYFTYQHIIAYGNVYMSGYDGYIRAFDITDGHLVWEYYFGNSGMETVYGTYPTYSGFHIADDKVYITNDEHSPDSVLWRGAKLHVMDAHTGAPLFNISGMMRHGAISDGIYTLLNSYDGQVYTFGKGPTKTTVSTVQGAVNKGNSIMILGSVTDQSPGQPDTPAVSDQSMSAWMEYLHMQKPIPGDVKGVEVQLSIIDPSGATQNIGTATTDMAGNFGFKWTPSTEGTYTVMATFTGTNSYSSSYATTYFAVDPAAPQGSANPTSNPSGITGSPTNPQQSPSEPVPPDNQVSSDIYIIAAVASIIVIVIAASAFMLRRRK